MLGEERVDVEGMIASEIEASITHRADARQDLHSVGLGVFAD